MACILPPTLAAFHLPFLYSTHSSRNKLAYQNNTKTKKSNLTAHGNNPFWQEDVAGDAVEDRVVIDGWGGGHATTKSAGRLIARGVSELFGVPLVQSSSVQN